MPAALERDLGLYATLTVSVGAMIGSGIFVLPGLATKLAGPAVVLAYLLAGVVVLPAALSKAEMATAMPESGGTYLYIDRAMGPLPGTVAGIGAWFSLVFKSAFALVGLGAYLLLFVRVPEGSLVFVSLGLAVAILLVNVVGVKQTGRLQAVVVSLVLLALIGFIAEGLTFVEQARYHPFLGEGTGGLFAATGFVFVSYAGVTKIASVAEEVADPGRNIPVGILGSVLVMMLVYTFVVFVVVGVVPAEALGDSLTPMALAAGSFLGERGRLVVAGVAVLALTSMANAGVLSASRFPLAMSRDALAPHSLSVVSERFRTPTYAIAFTGAVLLVLVAFVPVVDLAKLASAFQILVFVFVNVALVTFRESDLSWYDPAFVAPGYPWVQLFGVVGGLGLLTQMGALPAAGAGGLVLLGIGWYLVYGRERTEREGAAIAAIRRSGAERAVERARAAHESFAAPTALIPVGRPPTGPDRERFEQFVRLVADAVGPYGGEIRVVRFEEVPEQLDLATAATADDPADVTFTAGAAEAFPDLSVPISFGSVVTHDTRHAVANFVAEHGVDVVFGEWHPSRWHAELLGADVDWYMEHTTADFVFVRNRGYRDVERITLVANEGPFDPLEVVVADGVARSTGATVDLVATLDADASAEEVATAEDYLASLAAFVEAETRIHVATAPDRVRGIVASAQGADLVVVGTAAHHVIYDVLFGTVPDRVVERVDATVLLTHAGRSRRHTFIRALVDRLVY